MISNEIYLPNITKRYLTTDKNKALLQAIKNRSPVIGKAPPHTRCIWTLTFLLHIEYLELSQRAGMNGGIKVGIRHTYKSSPLKKRIKR